MKEAIAILEAELKQWQIMANEDMTEDRLYVGGVRALCLAIDVLKLAEQVRKQVPDLSKMGVQLVSESATKRKFMCPKCWGLTDGYGNGCDCKPTAEYSSVVADEATEPRSENG